jgi:hypothetical protein
MRVIHQNYHMITRGCTSVTLQYRDPNGSRLPPKEFGPSPGTNMDNYVARGIWRHFSMINHSCLSNATFTHIGDVVIVTAQRDIEAGQEIFLESTERVTSREDRRARLSSLRIDCHCRHVAQIHWSSRMIR